MKLDLGAAAVSAHWIGAHALIAIGDGRVAIASPDVEPRFVAAHDGAILSTALHPNGARVLTGGDDGKLCAIAPDGAVSELANYKGKWIHQLAASSASGLIVAAIGKDAIVLQNGAETHRFTHPSSIGGLALEQKGRRLAVAHYGGVTLRYALAADDKGVALNWKGSHLSVTLAPDASYVITAMQENELHGWRLPDKTDLRMSGYAAKTRSFSWDKRGRWLATSGADRAVIWPFSGKGPQGREAIQLAPRQALVTRVAFHPSEERLAIGYADGAVLVAQPANQSHFEIAPPGGAPINALAWEAQGARLAFADDAGYGAIVSA